MDAWGWNGDAGLLMQCNGRVQCFHQQGNLHREQQALFTACCHAEDEMSTYERARANRIERNNQVRRAFSWCLCWWSPVMRNGPHCIDGFSASSSRLG